jgi:VWFA-related protein
VRLLSPIRCGLVVLMTSGVAATTTIPQPASSSKTLFVTVTDRNRQPVRTLTEPNFTVYEDGKPLPITAFDANPPPLSVVILIDTSASMEESLDGASKAVDAFLSRLTGRDVAAVGGFNERVTMQPAVGFSGDLALLRAGLRQLAPGGKTSLYDALGRAVDRLADAHGHRVIVVFSDGSDTTSLLSATDVADRARAAEITVYALTMPLNMPWRSRTPDYDLKALASDSGGQMVMLSKVTDWAPAFAQVADELHGQYVVGFSPKAGAKVHKVEVKVTGKDLTVRTRKTYVASSAPQKR